MALRAGDAALGGEIRAFDGSFRAFFELCPGCHNSLVESDAARSAFHLKLRCDVRQLLTLASGEVGGRA